MPIAPASSISLSDIRTEIGATGAISLNDTNVRRLLNQTSGTADMGSGRGTAWIGTNRTNLNLMTLFSNPATVATYKVAIAPSINVDATSGNTALVVGQFPTGSSIQVNNYGNIRAYGGAGGSGGAGSSGGDAIYASYPNQTVVINNQTGAVIYGGGGGGGKGGTGGTGGTGGGGVYETQTGWRYDNGNFWAFNGSDNWIRWDGGYSYYYGSGNVGRLDNFLKGWQTWTNNKGQYEYTVALAYNAYTSGGAGGAGAAGGNGGRGLGADGAAAGGSAGGTGSNGSAGGTNAGAGGKGGNGGTGGTGGTWGTSGSTGSGGSTGNTGASGNNGGGSAGAAGAAGSAGGAAGRYLVKGANTVTLNNSGTVAGGLA